VSACLDPVTHWTEKRVGANVYPRKEVPFGSHCAHASSGWLYNRLDQR
jgi:hypothetical protein